MDRSVKINNKAEIVASVLGEERKSGIAQRLAEIRAAKKPEFNDVVSGSDSGSFDLENFTSEYAEEKGIVKAPEFVGDNGTASVEVAAIEEVYVSENERVKQAVADAKKNETIEEMEMVSEKAGVGNDAAGSERAKDEERIMEWIKNNRENIKAETERKKNELGRGKQTEAIVDTEKDSMIEDGEDVANAGPEKKASKNETLEQQLKEKGIQAGAELTEAWTQLSEAERAEPFFAVLAGANGNGRALFESFIEDIEDEIKQGRSEDEILQESVNAITALRDQARQYLAKENVEIVERSTQETDGAERGAGTQTESRVEQGIEVEAEKITRVREDVARARREFAEMEYKKKSMWGNVRGFFGKQKLEKTTGEIKGRSGEYAEVLADDDVTYMRALYDNKMIDYKNAVFEEIKAKGLEGEALEKAIKDATLEITALERCAAYDTKKTVEDENTKSTTFEAIKGTWKKSIDSYKKLPNKVKIAISVGLWAGAGAATLGGATGVAAGFAALNFGKRFLAGSAAGMGAYVGAEKVADIARKRNDNKGVEKIIENINKEFKELSPAERVDKLKERLTKEVMEINDKVDRREYWDTFRKTGAAVFGATLGSGVLGHWLTGASQQLGISESIHGILKEMGVEGSHDGFTASTNAYEHSIAGAAGAHVELPAQSLTVHEGSNFIATIKHDYLATHRDEFIKMHPKFANLNNDQIAFRLAKMYGDKNLDGHLPNFVKAGAKMTFDPKTLEVHFLKPGDVGDFPDNLPVMETVEAPDASEVTPAGTSVATTEQIVNEAIERHKQAEFLAKQEVVAGAQADFAIAHEDYAHAANEAAANVDDQAAQSLQGEMGGADKAMQQSAEYVRNNTDFFPETTKRTVQIQQFIASGNRGVWNEFQNLEYDKAVADDKVGPKLKAIKEQLEKEFGQKHAFTPKDGETVKQWSMRAVYKVMEKKYHIAN